MERSRLSSALAKPDPLAHEARLRQELQRMLGSIYQQVVPVGVVVGGGG